MSTSPAVQSVKIIYGPAECRVYADSQYLRAIYESFTVSNPDFDDTIDPSDSDYTPPEYHFFQDNKFPTGLIHSLIQWVDHQKLGLVLEKFPWDPRKGRGKQEIAVIPDCPLRPYQKKAVRRCLRWGRGVIEISTGGGKTEVAIATILSLQVSRALIIVPDSTGLEEFYSRLIKRGFPKREVGRIGAGKKEYDKPITVAIVNSLYNGVKEGSTDIVHLLRDTDVLFVDEVHHMPASSWREVTSYCGAHFRFGLSGTPYKDNESRKGNLHHVDSLITASLGPSLISVTPAVLQQLGYLTPCKVVRFPTEYKGKLRMYQWNPVYTYGVVKNSLRNKQIVSIVSRLAQEGRRPLISIERLEHGRMLQRMLLDEGVIAACSYGGATSYVPLEVSRSIESYTLQDETDFVGTNESVIPLFREGVIQVLIGSKVFDESADIPFLTDLINAAGGKASQRYRQKIGRILRLSQGKSSAIIWDPIDDFHPFLKKQSRLRMEIAEAEGYTIEGYEAPPPLPPQVYVPENSDLSIGYTMKEKEIEVRVDITVPMNMGNNNYAYVKPSVSIRALIEDGDDVRAVRDTLSKKASALCAMEAYTQAVLANEILTEGFQATVERHIKSLETVKESR